MRTHPHHHYHSLLGMRSLRKEVSETGAVLAATRLLMLELGLDARDMVLFDLCSGKGLTAVCIALEFPQSKVVAVDIHLTDTCLTRLSYRVRPVLLCCRNIPVSLRFISIHLDH